MTIGQTMTSDTVAAFLLLLVAASLSAAATASASAQREPPLPMSAPFPLFGGSTRAEPEDWATLHAMGATGGRAYGHWAFIQPTIVSYNQSLTVADVRATPSLISEWAATQADWSIVDARVAGMLSSGAAVLLEVGEGSISALPAYNGTTFDPNVVGESAYLAYVYLYTRAVVARYAPMGVRLYQVENELNEAWLESVSAVRVFRLENNAWRSWTFLSTLIDTLATAVRESAGPSGALVTTNLHTDVAEWVHEVLALPGYFADAAAAWAPSLDFIAFDAYPNMFTAEPCGAPLLATRVATIRNVTNDAVPVMVMETSVPVCSGVNCTTPLAGSLNFTAANQASCASEMVASVLAAGGQGFFWFVVTETPGMEPPPGGYTAEDASAMEMLATLYSDHEDPLVALEWLASPAHLSYLLSGRLQVILESIGQGFGVNDENGQPRPVVAALTAAFAAGMAV